MSFVSYGKVSITVIPLEGLVGRAAKFGVTVSKFSSRVLACRSSYAFTGGLKVKESPRYKEVLKTWSAAVIKLR